MQFPTKGKQNQFHFVLLMEVNASFFYHHICHFCKIKSAYIKTCSGCKLVSYCSQIHQKKEWRSHKSLCLTVQCYLKVNNIKRIFCFPVENMNEWRRNRLNVICAMELKLQRPLKICEKQMFLFPNVCPVCCILNPSREHFCEDCYYTRYCTSEHKFLHFEEHKRECLAFKQCYEVDKLCFDSKGIPIDFEIPCPDGSSFLETMDCFLTKYASSYIDIAKIFLSEHLSGALSLLSVINCNDYLRGKDKLNVHIIGASDYEQSVLMSIELLFHWFACLNKIKLVLIGPEICENYLEPHLCELCSKNKIFILDVEKKLYHQYIESDNFSVPDVIFSFNCGFSEFLDTDEDTWKESFQYLWNFKNGLLVFTSYTESEAKMDIEAFMKTKPKKEGIKLTVSSFRNPFKSLRPYRNWECFESSVFYNNNYITIMKIRP